MGRQWGKLAEVRRSIRRLTHSLPLASNAAQLVQFAPKKSVSWIAILDRYRWIALIARPGDRFVGVRRLRKPGGRWGNDLCLLFGKLGKELCLRFGPRGSPSRRSQVSSSFLTGCSCDQLPCWARFFVLLFTTPATLASCAALLSADQIRRDRMGRLSTRTRSRESSGTRTKPRPSG